MRRKWASCSSSGTLMFSSELLSQPAAFREAVVVHELLHLLVPNHGRLFKSLLTAHLPDVRLADRVQSRRGCEAMQTDEEQTFRRSAAPERR
jgi:predicted metal-dependent hydrolase